MVDEEHLDASRPKPGNGFPRIGQQAVARPPALMTKPGNPKRLIHSV